MEVRISWSAKYVTLQEIFLTYKFSYLLFPPTPPIQLRLGLQIGGETTNCKPPGPIIMIGQSEIGNISQIKFITLLQSEIGNISQSIL